MTTIREIIYDKVKDEFRDKRTKDLIRVFMRNTVYNRPHPRAFSLIYDVAAAQSVKNIIMNEIN